MKLCGSSLFEALEREGAVTRDGTDYRLPDDGAEILEQSDHDQYALDF